MRSVRSRRGRSISTPITARKHALQDLGGPAGQVEALSEREFAVFIQLARGQSVNNIAETLSLLAEHGRHASLQHQAEARRGEPRPSSR